MLLSLLILANQTAYKDRQNALFVRSLGCDMSLLIMYCPLFHIATL